jgi:hypothetical protein
VREVYGVSKLYKRKSKKSRNSSIQAPTIKLKRKKDVIVVANNSEQGYVSDRSSAFEDEEEESSQHEVNNFPEKEEEKVEPKNIKIQKKQKNDVVVKDEEQGIKDLLKEAGLLI